MAYVVKNPRGRICPPTPPENPIRFRSVRPAKVDHVVSPEAGNRFEAGASDTPQLGCEPAEWTRDGEAPPDALHIRGRYKGTLLDKSDFHSQ